MYYIPVNTQSPTPTYVSPLYISWKYPDSQIRLVSTQRLGVIAMVKQMALIVLSLWGAELSTPKVLLQANLTKD